MWDYPSSEKNQESSGQTSHSSPQLRNAKRKRKFREPRNVSDNQAVVDRGIGVCLWMRVLYKCASTSRSAYGSRARAMVQSSQLSPCRRPPGSQPTTWWRGSTSPLRSVSWLNIDGLQHVAQSSGSCFYFKPTGGHERHPQRRRRQKDALVGLIREKGAWAYGFLGPRPPSPLIETLQQALSTQYISAKFIYS